MLTIFNGDTKVEKMREIREVEILNAIITAIEDSSPDGMCKNCPTIQLIKDIADEISEKRCRKIMKEMGIEFDPKKCPCFEKFKDWKQ